MTRSLRYSLVDAFALASSPFTGNPASVLVLDEPLPEELMQKIAAEFNHSETAFVVRRSSPSEFDLRWFTPTLEVALCGHATLASAAVLFKQGAPGPLTFHTRSGALVAEKTPDGKSVQLDFPADDLVPVEGDDRESAERALRNALRAEKDQMRIGFVGKGKFDWLFEVEGVELADLPVDISALVHIPSSRGVILTTGSSGVSASHRFYSRFFGPAAGVDEDPVTGSAHCTLGPYWSGRLSAAGEELRAGQGGPRRGEIAVMWDGKSENEGGRCKLRGEAVVVAEGTLFA